MKRGRNKVHDRLDELCCRTTHAGGFEGYVSLFPLCFLVGAGGAESHPVEGDSQSAGVQAEVRELYCEQVLLSIQDITFKLLMLWSLSCSELMMRDNLFEIVTGSRTFYIQVPA